MLFEVAAPVPYCEAGRVEDSEDGIRYCPLGSVAFNKAIATGSKVPVKGCTASLFAVETALYVLIAARMPAWDRSLVRPSGTASSLLPRLASVSRVNW